MFKMSNIYTDFFMNQVGGSMPYFAEMRYQKGHGFFGRIFSGIGNFLKTLAPSVGKRVLPSAISLAQDIIEGENVGQSTKRRLKETGKEIADKTLTSLKNKLQSGTGIPYKMQKRKFIFKRKNKTNKIKNKRKKKLKKTIKEANVD